MTASSSIRARTTARWSATFTVRAGGVPIGAMTPSKRSFATRSMTTNEAALMVRGASQLYLSLGDSKPDGSIAIRFYYKPLVMLIWLGAVVMMLGGALSLSDRRLRVGAPKPAAKPACRRRSRAPCAASRFVALLAALLAPPFAHGGDAGRNAEGPGAGGARARASRANCAAWSARTRTSTIRQRRWRTICACWCATG